MSTFTPKDLRTPNKHLPDVSKLVFTHTSTLHSFINDWVRLKDKGLKICRSISALRIHEFQDGAYPRSLGPLTESLLEALDGLAHVVEGIDVVNKKMKAVMQLQPSGEPVINTWSASKISQHIDKLYQSILKEFGLKQCVTENIAHCRDENLIEVYVSSWEMDVYCNIDDTAYLFAEIGLTGIT